MVRKFVSVPPSQPAVVYEGQVRARGFDLDRLAGLLLRANDEHVLPACNRIAHKIDRLIEARDGLLEVDDVDAVAFRKDEPLHLWVPAAGLVAEVNAGFQELFHADRGNQ